MAGRRQRRTRRESGCRLPGAGIARIGGAGPVHRLLRRRGRLERLRQGHLSPMASVLSAIGARLGSRRCGSDLGRRGGLWTGSAPTSTGRRWARLTGPSCVSEGRSALSRRGWRRRGGISSTTFSRYALFRRPEGESDRGRSRAIPCRSGTARFCGRGFDRARGRYMALRLDDVPWKVVSWEVPRGPRRRKERAISVNLASKPGGGQEPAGKVHFKGRDRGGWRL